MAIRLLFSAILFWIPIKASALFELGYSTSYRKSHISENAYDESLHHTGSLSYYFFGSSALEFSTTIGTSERVVPSGTTLIKQIYDVSIYGLDLVFNYGDRQSTFAPYIKIGAAYFAQKKITTYLINMETGAVADASEPFIETSVVPSAGIGMRWNFTDRLGLRMGFDIWSSRPIDQTPLTFDMAARVGLSWFL